MDEPQLTESTQQPQTGTVNTIWLKAIPRTNLVFMIISALLVFGLDLFILIQSPELAAFWYIMLAVFAIFIFFYMLENSFFKKRLSTSRTKADGWIVGLVVLRDVVFVLNFIPLIQLLGMAALVVGGIPYLIIYGLLLFSRSKAAYAN